MTTILKCNQNDIKTLYVFRLLFAVVRPLRSKYRLSVNCIMTLNSCYLYSKLIKEEFYISDIVKFNSYYDLYKIKRYFRVITLRGFISPINPGDHRVLYRVTEKTEQAISELLTSYNIELYKFANKYNIDL